MSDAPSWIEIAASSGISAIPGIGGPIQTVLNGVADRRRARAQNAVGVLSERFGADVLLARTIADPEYDALLATALDSIIRTGLEAKRRVLVKVVANAFESDEPIDTAQLVVMTLSELDGPHIRALARIRNAERVAERGEWEVSPEGYSEPELDAAFTAGRNEQTPVLSALIRTGVLYPATLIGGGVATIGTTPFGKELLSYLEDECKPLP